MNLAEIRSEAQDILGLDLTDSEADRLANEGATELCVRSEWTRSNVVLGPTVSDTIAYNLPSTVHKPLSLYVDGYLYTPADERVIRQIETGELRQRAFGFWWISFTSSGVEQVSLYPTPSSAVDLTLLAVVYPDEMTDDTDEPAVPSDFHRAVVDYIAAISLGGSEDNFELRLSYQEQFERQVGRLRRHRLSRTGRGPVEMRIAGSTAT